ncbi:MAG: hypothetical protein HYZ29_35275 [Myxococcales bacterium]|nr:hypothetical protein [Myxococcales bacterium]
MSLRSKLAGWPQALLLRSACYAVLAALAVMSYSIVVPKPLPVIAAMSVGHVLCVVGFACFGLAVLVEMATRPGARSSLPPTSKPAPKSEPASKG